MNDDGRTDAALLAATARGDNAAFAVLVRRYIRVATLLAAQLLGNRDWATDRGEPASSRSEATLVAHLDAAAAKRAMGMLSAMQWACFELVVVRGLSSKEVAAMHGISESTVRQHVFRARTALRGALEGNDRRPDES